MAAVDSRVLSKANGVSLDKASVITTTDVTNVWPLERMPPCELPPLDEFTPVERYVSAAVASRSDSSTSDNNDNKNRSYLSGYRNICDCVRKKQDPHVLWKILLALRGHPLSLLSSRPTEHALLLHLVLKLDPFVPGKPKKTTSSGSGEARHDPLATTTHDEERDAHLYFTTYKIANAYLHLLVGLVSANSTYLVPCLNVMWKHVYAQPNASVSKTSRLHSALATTLRLVPKAHTELFPILQRSVPFRRAAVREQRWYAEHCLAVLEYAPGLHEEMLGLLVNKCLEIDVEIKVGVGGVVTLDVQEEVGKEIDFDAVTEEKKEESVVAVEEIKVEADDMADRLDVLMTILMRHVRTYSVTFESNRLNHLANMLMRIFDSSILTTHRSKYVQFLLFYLCGLQDRALHTSVPDTVNTNVEPVLYRKFAAHLIHNLLSSGLPTLVRQSSVCYLASFVSRASYVNPCTVCESIVALLRWGDAYLDTYYDKQERPPQPHTPGPRSAWRRQVEAHAVFYTVCQAAFYIMCFRGKEAVTFYKETALREAYSHDEEDDDDGIDLVSVDIGPHRWHKLCGHAELQPLKYCLESVRREFLHLAEVFRLLPQPLVESIVREDEKVRAFRVFKKQQQQSTPGKNTTTPVRRRPRRSLSISTPATREKQRLSEEERQRRGEKVGGGVGGLGKGSNPLDSFFPFDPCLLRQSYEFVDPFYQHWDGGVEHEEVRSALGNDNDESSDDSSDSSESSSSSSCGGYSSESGNGGIETMSCVSSANNRMDIDMEESSVSDDKALPTSIDVVSDDDDDSIGNDNIEYLSQPPTSQKHLPYDEMNVSIPQRARGLSFGSAGSW